MLLLMQLVLMPHKICARTGLSLSNTESLLEQPHNSGMQAEGETILAMELWWRAAALEALQAYMASVLPKASRSHSTRLQRLLGSLLQPTLDAVFGSPALQARHAPMCYACAVSADGYDQRMLCWSLAG